MFSDFLKRMQHNENFRPASAEIWSGRVDSSSDPDAMRIHQLIEILSAGSSVEPGRPIALLGFACDEGVKRNKGRIGAAAAPDEIRRSLASLPWPFENSGDGPAPIPADHRAGLPGSGRTAPPADGSVGSPGQARRIIDAGTVLCPDEDLEAAQQLLSEAVTALRTEGFLVIVLGGGHETAWGHYSALLDESAGSGKVPPFIVNFDAHLDMRPDRPGSSGTPFDQAADACTVTGQEFRYYCAGLRHSGNTAALRNHASGLGALWSELRDFHRSQRDGLDMPPNLRQFIDDAEGIYLTIDLDVFAAAWAPGVSAASSLGLMPRDLFPVLEYIAASGRLTAMDVVELNPRYDIDGRTAGLAAQLIWTVLNRLA